MRRLATWLTLGLIAFGCVGPSLLHAQTPKDSTVVICHNCVAVTVPAHTDSTEVVRVDTAIAVARGYAKTVYAAAITWRDSILKVPVVIPPVVVPPAITGAFYADWGTATGTTTAALTDGGRWDDAGACDNPNLAVVDGSVAPGAPSKNVYQVTNRAGGKESCAWVQKANLWPNPQVGQTRYWRVYLYNATDNSQLTSGGEASYHPLEFASKAYNGMEEFNLIFSSNADGTFPFKIAPLKATFPKNRWIPTTSGKQAMLAKFAWTRIEWSLTKTAPLTYVLHAKVFDRFGSPLYDDTSFRDASLGGTMAATGTGIVFLSDQTPGQLRIGTNGGSVWEKLTADQHIYWAAVCVRADTWCGPYVPGEH